MEVAARENASSQKTVYELKDLLQKIALQDKMDESREFAARIQQHLYTASVKANSRTKNRGVKKAPFVVLIGASMPSVLAEIGFVSNPKDEALLSVPRLARRSPKVSIKDSRNMRDRSVSFRSQVTDARHTVSYHCQNRI